MRILWNNKNQVREVKKLALPSQDGGSLFDVNSSHGLGEIALKSLLNSGIFLGRRALSSAVKSDVAKRGVKKVMNKYLDQALDSFSADISKKIDPIKGSGIDYSQWYPMDMYTNTTDPTNPLYQRGGAVDIHKAILKVAPKKGFVMPGHRYTGPGNPLEQQLKYDPNTGQILEIYQQPTGRTDAVSMQHDVDYSVCGNKPKAEQVKCKNKADKKMVKSLDDIPWKDRQWGHAVARNAIAAKAKLGLGVKKPKNVKSRRVKRTGKKN